MFIFSGSNRGGEFGRGGGKELNRRGCYRETEKAAAKKETAEKEAAEKEKEDIGADSDEKYAEELPVDRLGNDDNDEDYVDVEGDELAEHLGDTGRAELKAEFAKLGGRDEEDEDEDIGRTAVDPVPVSRRSRQVDESIRGKARPRRASYFDFNVHR